MKSSVNSIKRIGLVLTIITLSSKILGFFRDVVLAYFFGTSYMVDAYLMALSIPVILMAFLYHLSYSITPIYLNVKTNHNEEKANIFISNMVHIILYISAACAILFILFSKQIVAICAPGFTGDILEITVRFFKVTIFVQIIVSLSQVFFNYLNSNGKFLQASLSMLFVSSTQLIFTVLSGILKNSMFLVWGSLTSNLLYFLSLYKKSIINKFTLKLRLKYDENIKNALIMTVPLLLSNGLMQINAFTDKWFASSLPEGSISALNYGNTLKTFIFTIFTIAITTMIYPMLSQAVAEKNISKVKEIFSKGSNIIIILFVPITIGAIILARPAISFVFQRGEFGGSSALMTTSAFIMYSIGLLAIALRDVITKVFYSMQDTKSTLYIGAFAVAINIILNIILIKPMGHAGLALATSLSAIIGIPLFFIMLRKKLGALGLENSFKLFIKSCISSAVMGVIVYFGYNILSTSLGSGKLFILLSICISAGVGGLVYFALMIAMKVKEMDFFTDIIKKVLVKIKH